MAILEGCEAQHRTPVPEDRKCPQCGEEVEVFVVKGRIVEGAACSCGYVFEAEPAVTPALEK